MTFRRMAGEDGDRKIRDSSWRGITATFTLPGISSPENVVYPPGSYRKRKVKDGAFSLRAFHTDGSSMGGDDLLDYRQAEPDT